MSETVDLGVAGLSPAVYVGAGGSANVFAARVLETNEQVAVKLLRASADSTKERERFEREHETLSLLSTHDGIVHVVDAGVTDRNEPYFLMPLMEGSLQDRIDNEGAMEWETATQLVSEVADTVEFAHSNKILHRDLKPGNILLDSDGVPRVSDFGIAKLMDSSVSKSSKSLGTPSFMPPERFRAVDATEASDVYGLGATLAALLTGTAPFITGENDTDAAVMMRVINEEPPPLIDAGIPSEVASVVTRSMAKDPADRPASAAEFSHLLRTATVDAGGVATSGPVTVAIPHRDLNIPTAAAVTGAATPTDEETKKRSVWMLAAAGFLFVTLLGVGGAFALSNQDDSTVESADGNDVSNESTSGDPAAVDPADSNEGSDESETLDAQANTPGVVVDGKIESNEEADVDGGDAATVGDHDKDLGEETVDAGGTGDGGARDTRDEQSALTEKVPTTDTTNPPATEPAAAKPEVILPPVEPTACFSPSSQSVETGTSVSFANCSTDASSYSWDFGDGSTSTLRSPSKAWSTAGTKAIRLTVTGAGGTGEATRNITVTAAVVAAPMASFTTSAPTIDPGDTVTFTSSSTGHITTYDWEFGDGNTAAGATAWHKYNHHGTYTAKLTVTGPGGSHSATRTITVRQPTTTPVFTQRIDIGDIGETNLRFRFTSNITTGYTIRIRSGSTVAATQNGTATANVLVGANVGGLTPGTDYTVQVTLHGPPSVDSSSVSFRTPGGTPTPTVTPVALQNLRLVDTQSTRFEVNYESNVCANGSFVIREQGGPVVGSNAGQPDGCTTRHLGIPGFWTPSLKPNTTYVITVTVEANGQGEGNGNTATQSLTVTTSG